MNAVASHPSLALWENVDEAAWSGHAFGPLRDGYAFLHRLDPAHPIWTNQAPRGPLSTLTAYNKATDVAGCDIYPVPVPSNHSDLPNHDLSVVGDETARFISTVAGAKPVIMILQAFAWKSIDDPDDPAAVYPSLDQSRFMAYDAIVAGASGLVWWSPDETWPRGSFWADLKNVVSELRGIMPILEAPVPAGAGLARILGKPGPVRMSERRVGTRRALILVNRSARPTRVAVRTGSGTSEGWQVLVGDPSVSQRGDTLVMDLPAWGVRVLSTDPALRPRRQNFRAETSGAIGATAGAQGQREHGEPIRNGSFEAVNASGVPWGWIVLDPSCATLDRDQPHSGDQSLRLASESAEFRTLIIQRKIPVEIGKQYRASVWLRSDTPGAQANFYTEWVEGTTFHTFASAWLSPGRAWKQEALQFVATPGTKGQVYFVLQVQGPGRVWFDDVEMTKSR